MPAAKQVTVEVPVPVTVEVTRIVPQPIIIEATPGPPQTCAPEAFEDTDEIVIGGLLPLSTSGDMLSGFAMQAAMSIAVDEINESGGVRGLPLRLVTYNSGRRNTQALSYLQRLARDDCAVAVTGLLHDEVAIAVANRANAMGLPVVIAGASTDEIPALQHPYVFRIAASDTMLAEMPAIWLAEVGDYNNDGGLYVITIVDSRAQDTPSIARYESKLDEYGIIHSTLPVDLPASDFSSVIARIVSQDKLPDAVFIFVQDEAALELEQQIRAAGISPQRNSLIVNNEAALNSEAFWKSVPDGVGTVVSRIGPWNATVTPAGQNFALKYASYFDHWPESYAFAAYDAVHLLAAALEQSDSLSGEDLRHAIAATDTILASGRYYFPYTSTAVHNAATQPDCLWNQWPDVHTLFLQYDENGQKSSDMPVVWPERHRTVEGPLAWMRAEGE